MGESKDNHDLVALCCAAGVAALSRLPYAVIVVDERARVVLMNVAASGVLLRSSALRVVDGVLHTAADDEDRELAAAIAAAAGLAPSSSSGGQPIRVTDGRTEIPLLIVPATVTGDPLVGRRGLAFVLFGGDAQTPHRDFLVSMYSLTAREADLACELLRGHDVAAAARSLGMTLHTARTHLRHLMEKTDTRRQGELVRVLLRSIPPRA